MNIMHLLGYGVVGRVVCMYIYIYCFYIYIYIYMYLFTLYIYIVVAAGGVSDFVFIIPKRVQVPK